MPWTTLRQALNALGEVDLTLTLRAERLPDEQMRGILQCILRDHLGQAIVELKAPRQGTGRFPPPPPSAPPTSVGRPPWIRTAPWRPPSSRP